MMNSNTYGGYLVTVFPIGIGWLFAARRRWERALAIAALLAIGTALVLTFCRGSLYAMAVAVLLLAWWLRAVWLPPAAFLHYLFCMGIAPQGLAHYKAAFAMGETVRQRLALWTAAWRMAKKSPLVGAGVGNYIRLAPAQGVASYEKLKGLSGHNSYLEILVEQGLVGLAAFGILLVLNFLPALRRLFRSKGMADPWLAALTAGALAFAQQNLTNSQFLHKPNSAVAWLLMGLMVSRLHGLPPMVSPPRRRSLTTSATPRRPAL